MNGDGPTGNTARYFEKEKEYRRINDQLEQKSSDLFDRIEKFSKSRYSKLLKNHQIQNGGSGDFISSAETKHPEDGGGDASIRKGTTDYASSDHEVEDANSTTELLKKHLAFLTNTKASRSISVCSVRSERQAKPQPGRLQLATESVIKNLQAKLINYEDRLADLHYQYRQKIQENTILESRVKSLEDERDKLLKTIDTLHSTVEKHARTANESKSSLSLKEVSLSSMKREMEDLKRELRNRNGNNSSIQARLHRALEENDKLKAKNTSLGIHNRQSNGESRQKLDSLTHRIQELERERILLQANLQKQTPGVDKLKNRRCPANTSTSTPQLTDSRPRRRYALRNLETDAQSCISATN